MAISATQILALRNMQGCVEKTNEEAVQPTLVLE